MGDQVDLPIDKEEEVQQRGLHKKSQPLEQLDRVIDKIRKLMLKSSEVVNERELNKIEPTIAVGKKKQKRKKKQQQQ
jgi:hypothetical protein